MFPQFGSFTYPLPLIIFNPWLYHPFETFQYEERETLSTENKIFRTQEFQEGPQQILKLSKEQRLESIRQLLWELHRGSSGSKKTHWSQSQDQLLEKLVQKQKMQWKEIPKYFEGRTLSMCYSRYRRILMNTKQGWKKQDDELIINLVKNIGQKWKQISTEVPKFTPKQIRERYLNYLRPNIDKSEFNFEEDFKICQLVLEHGKHWRKFQEELPGRTEGSIKSRFYSKLKDIIENS